jgi:hypothetical protein
MLSFFGFSHRYRGVLAPFRPHMTRSPLKQTTVQVLASIASLTDDELLLVKQQAKAIGNAAWRIECAADAEIVRRAAAKGEKKAIVEAAAYASGVTAPRIYENARISAVIDSYEQSRGEPNLPTTINKTDVAASLDAPDPTAALSMIVEKKAADPTYTTRQAREDVKAMKEEAKKPAPKSMNRTREIVAPALPLATFIRAERNVDRNSQT